MGSVLGIGIAFLYEEDPPLFLLPKIWSWHWVEGNIIHWDWRWRSIIPSLEIVNPILNVNFTTCYYEINVWTCILIIVAIFCTSNLYYNQYTRGGEHFLFCWGPKPWKEKAERLQIKTNHNFICWGP